MMGRRKILPIGKINHLSPILSLILPVREETPRKSPFAAEPASTSQDWRALSRCLAMSKFSTHDARDEMDELEHFDEGRLVAHFHVLQKGRHEGAVFLRAELEVGPVGLA